MTKAFIFTTILVKTLTDYVCFASAFEKSYDG